VLIIRRINYINTTSVIYQRLYWYNWFSWWWARGCSKHVENLNKYIEKNCASSWSFTMTHIIRKFEYVFRWTSHAATDRRTDTSQEVSCRTVEEIWGREMTALHCRCSRGCVWPVGIYCVFWKVAVGCDLFWQGNCFCCRKWRGFWPWRRHCQRGLCPNGLVPTSPRSDSLWPRSIACIYRVSQDEWTKLREIVPYVELRVYRCNPKHLYPKLNGYGDKGHRKVWLSGVSTYCTPSVTPYSYTVHARQRDTAS